MGAFKVTQDSFYYFSSHVLLVAQIKRIALTTIASMPASRRKSDDTCTSTKRQRTTSKAALDNDELIVVKKTGIDECATTKTEQLLVSAEGRNVMWKGALLAKGSPLSPIARKLGGLMGGDETGTVCLIFPKGVKLPSSCAVRVRGCVRWVADEGSLALFVDEVIEHTTASPESSFHFSKVAVNLVFCRSAPVLRIAVLVLCGEDPASYRVLVKKSADGFELPWAQPAQLEVLRETALRVASSALPTMPLATLTSLNSSVVEFDPTEDGMKLFTSLSISKSIMHESVILLTCDNCCRLPGVVHRIHSKDCFKGKGRSRCWLAVARARTSGP